MSRTRGRHPHRVLGQLGRAVVWRVRRGRFWDTEALPPRPTIASASPPAAPMPASPQSKPLRARLTRTITAGALTERLGLVACVLAAPDGT